jgi:hypothetical protein
VNLIAGLDLAAVRDYSALAMVERVEVASADYRQAWVNPSDWEPGYWDRVMVPEQHYLVRHLVRWPRGTDPGEVVDDTAALLEEPQIGEACLLRYDATGMGIGVKSIIQERWRAGRFGAHRPIGINIHGGDESNGSSVAKVDLVSTVVRLLRERRLHLARGMQHVDQLRKELLGFQVKVTATGREKYEAQTESLHDDMVIAVALAVFGKPRYHAAPRYWAPEELTEALGEQTAEVR